MEKIAQPIIHEMDYTVEGLKRFTDSSINFNTKKRKYLLDYPTVYIINNESRKNTYNIYIGETSDIKVRTNRHLLEKKLIKNCQILDWLQCM